MGTRELVFDIFAIDRASKVFTKVGAEAESMGSKTLKVMQGIGKATAIAAVAVGVASVKMAADYQEATTLLVTGAGESEKNIGLIRDGLLTLAPAVGIGPTALAKAMFMVESAGYHGAEGLLVMKSAAEGAKIGGADATVVANGLTTALTDYHLPASKAAEVTSKLIATVSAGKTNMGDLTASLSGILPFASSLGVKFNDITGAMATMTGEGIDAANASTMLRFTMMSLANETPKGKKALASIGMTAQQLKNDLASKGVGGALSVVTAQIAKHFPAGSVKATAALAAIAGGTRGMGAALALTGTHAATLIANTKSIAGASTEAGGHVKGWAETQKDFNLQIAKAWAAIQVLGIKIGNVLIPIVMKIVDWTTKHTTAVKIIAGIIGGILLVAMGLWIVSLIQAGIAIIGATWPVLLIVAAIAGLAAGLVYCWTHFQTFRDVVTTVFHAVEAIIGAVVQVIIGYFRMALAVWGGVIGGLLSMAATVAEKLHLPFASGLRAASNEFNNLRNAADAKLAGVASAAGSWGAQTGANFAAGLGGRAYSAAQAANNMGRMVASGFASGIAANSALASMAAASMAARAQASMAANLRPPGHATGTQNFAGGLTRINEQGPETVFLPSGSRIATAGQSARMSGGGGGTVINVTVNGALDPGAVGRQVHQILLAEVRKTGRGLGVG